MCVLYIVAACLSLARRKAILLARVCIFHFLKSLLMCFIACGRLDAWSSWSSTRFYIHVHLEHLRRPYEGEVDTVEAVKHITTCG